MSRLPEPFGHRILVDTSAFFALYSADDILNARAVSIGEAARGRLFTTNFIVAETHALLLRRLGWRIAVLFLNEVEHSRMIVVRVSLADERRAREIITLHDDKDYSLTDAMNFAAMERLRIGEAFTFDRHFAQYGFTVFGPEQV
jgi:predicted nucleic acid-binding protein